MSRVQHFVIGWVDPETAAAIEAHSRAWKVQCPHCQFERSIWDLGGLRYKAAGRPRTRGRCPSCGRSGWHKVYKDPNIELPRAPSWSMVRLVLSVVLAATFFVALIVAIVLKLAGSV